MAHPVVQILKVGDVAGLVRAERTDGQLLDLFVKQRDQEAFAALVRRHGGLVLGVCRRMLRNPADVDDAFQAAFLVLARKASTIGRRGLLANWLHGVAYNTARKLRRSNLRRSLREQPLMDEPVASNGIELREELLAILDEELNKLPERYRTPIVLCDLEGHTRKEAAGLIGCPEGTVAGRLARARALLAERLASRGIAPSAGIVAAILAQRSASAVSPTLVSSTLNALRGAASLCVAGLAEGVVMSLFLNKLKTAVVSALVVAVAVVGLASTFRTDANAGTEPAAPSEEKAKKAEGEEKILTTIPLKKLAPIDTAAQLTKTIRDALIIPLIDDRALLVYATKKVTENVEAALVALGEEPRKSATVIRLKNVSSADAARVLMEVFGKTGRVTVVPVADENAVIVHAAESDLKTIRGLLDKTIDAAGIVPPKPAPLPQKTFTINFRNVPWKDAIAWFAESSGLTFVGDKVPTGTLTLQPPKDRRFTLAEVVDLLNESLVQQRYILIRRSNTFILHPSDEKVDGTWIPRIDLDQLPARGKTEMVQVLIPLKGLKVEEVAPEIQKMLTPFGLVSILGKSNTLVLLDMAGNIRRIVDTLRNVEGAFELPMPQGGNDPRNGWEGLRPLPTPGTAFPVMPMDKSAPFQKMPFQMKEVPWSEALEWYSKATGLTPVINVKLTGWFTPPNVDRELTIPEMTDILNESLISQKLILVRRLTTFVILPTNEKIDGIWVPLVELTDLPNFGKSELVQVLIQVRNQAVADVAPEIRKMLSPQGLVSLLLRTNTLLILDTAANVRRIHETIRKVDVATNENFFEVYQCKCKWKRADDVVEALNQQLGDKAKTLRVVSERTSNSVVLIGGPAETLELAKKLLVEIDKPKNPGDKPFVRSDLEIRKYRVPFGTAEAVAKDFQAALPAIRIMPLPLSHEVMAYAAPEDHLKLSDMIKKLDFDSKLKTEIIPIVSTDAAELVAKLQKLFPKATIGPDIRPCFWGAAGNHRHWHARADPGGPIGRQAASRFSQDTVNCFALRVSYPCGSCHSPHRAEGERGSDVRRLPACGRTARAAAAAVGPARA